jgi:hypothetical protein
MTETEERGIGPLYEKLKALAGEPGDTAGTGELAQEILDFLAMAAGLKPVLLLGRGPDSPGWVGGAAELAREFCFTAVEGPFWDATPYGKFPAWYADHSTAQLAPRRATYVCSSPETERRIAAVGEAGGRLSMTAEARLLGYPACCVVAHYDRAVRYHRAIFAILTRLAGGDEARMRALLRGGAALAPETETEIAAMQAAFDLHPAPFGSWNRCRHCARNDDSPSAALSEQYRALAKATGGALWETLSGQ